MLRWCCDDVATSLRRRGFLARKVMVKLRFPDLSYATKGHTLGCPTDAASVLYPQCANLLLSMMGMAPESAHAISLTRPVRLAGMSASGLVLAEEAVIQPSLDDLLEENEVEQRAEISGGSASRRRIRRVCVARRRRLMRCVENTVTISPASGCRSKGISVILEVMS